MSDEDKAVQVRLTMPEKYRRLFKALCTERDTDMSKEVTRLVEQQLIDAGKLTRKIEEVDD